VNDSQKVPKNQIAVKVVWFSFCAVWACVLYIVLFAWSNQAWAQQNQLADKASQWSDQAWTRAPERIHRALANAPLDSAKSREFEQTPKAHRGQVLSKFIEDLLTSETFAKAQAAAWMKDQFGIEPWDPLAPDRIERSGWDTSAFRDWLIKSFQENTPFDAFVQSQLIGVSDPPSKLPTHAWYLAGQWTNYRILESPTPIESNLVRQFQTALESIERTEAKDWQRLVEQSQKGSNDIRRWWNSQRTWPTIPEEELVWSWPRSSQADSKPIAPSDRPDELSSKSSPLGLGSGASVSVSHAPVLRGFREWTLVLAGNFSKELLGSSEPVTLLVQSPAQSKDPSDQGSESLLRTLRLELRQGRLCVRLIHDFRISSQEIQTQEPIPAGQTIQIAIINDGLGRSDSIRILLDGEPMSTVVSEGASKYFKEVGSSQGNHWQIGSDTKGAWQLEQVILYRLALSGPECRGFADSLWQENWEEFDEQTRTEWVEHYARRVDPQWRYQRESRSHYVTNMAAVLESQSMLPVVGALDQPIFLVEPERFPNTLLGAGRISSLDRSEVVRTSASEWSVPSKLVTVEDLARTEIQRTWQSMLHNSQEKNRSGEPLDRFVVDFMSDWDRKRLILKLTELLMQQDQ